jgi:hypothetical protein
MTNFFPIIIEGELTEIGHGADTKSSIRYKIRDSSVESTQFWYFLVKSLRNN